jgi:hypothetical protein
MQRRYYASRYSTIITLKSMIEDILDVTEDKDQSVESLHSCLFGKTPAEFEDTVINSWRRLCAEEFFKEHYSVSDVLMVSSKGYVVCVVSKDDANLKNASEYAEATA